MYASEVHVWLVDVDDEEAVPEATDFLPESERDRLGALLQPQRRRGICAQAALRILVAAATTGTAPLPELVRGWNGKPVLEAWGHLDDGRPLPPLEGWAPPPGPGREPGSAPRPLQVSLSHSGPIAAVALCTAGLTGVDVERVRELPDAERLARSTMSRAEFAQWLRTRPSRRADALFRAWTRKESVLKALGTGLSGGLQSVSAPLAAARGRVPLHTVPENAGRPEEWSVHDLPALPGYAAAVAVRTPRLTVRQHRTDVRELLRTARPVPRQAANPARLPA